jgi:hypothetical protein
MTFFRIDKDPIPDEQSYYDFFSSSKQRGNWALPNAFKSKEEAVSFLYKNNMPLDLIDKLLVKTEFGWQLPTPPKTLFGLDTNSEHALDGLKIFFHPGFYLQIWEGNTVGDIYEPFFRHEVAGVNVSDIQTYGDLFYPIKLLISMKIPEGLDMPIGMGMDPRGGEAEAWQQAFIEWIDEACEKKGIDNPLYAARSKLTSFLLGQS